MRKHNKKGFTLIELIVVILILGVLAAIAAPVTFKSINQAKDAADTANASAMTSAIRLYIAGNPDADLTTATIGDALIQAGMITATSDVPTTLNTGKTFSYDNATKEVKVITADSTTFDLDTPIGSLKE